MKISKRLVSVLCALFLIGSFASPVFAAESELPFTDVPTSYWKYDAIKFVYEQGIMKGVTDTTFQPTGTLNRAMMVTILYRLSGEPIWIEEPPFTDLDPERYYYDAVCWAAEIGLAKGRTATTFEPGSPVTQQEALVFLYRYGQHEECENLTYVLPDPTRMTGRLSDSSYSYTIGNFAKNAANWAMNCGILADNVITFDGTLPATRAICADYVYKFYCLVLMRGKALTNSEFNISGGMDNIANKMSYCGYPAYVQEDLFPIALEYAFYNSEAVYLSCHGTDSGADVLPHSGYPNLALDSSMIDQGKMENVDLAYISACYAGTDFAKTLQEVGGAAYAIGFTKEIWFIYDEDREGFEAAEHFSDIFWEQVMGHVSYEDALEAAEKSVLDHFRECFGLDSYELYS